jgi:ABC-2 type transport system permease protein
MPATTTLPRPAGGPLPLFAGLLRSESRKLHTVRSTFWALLAAVAFIDSVRVSLGGLHLSQVAIGLLGVLAVTSEYSSGMIRATLAAVPQRRLLLTAKALVFTAAAAATGIAACLAAYLVFQAFLPPGDAMRTTLAGPGVLRPVTGAGLYLTVLVLLGLGLGTVLRSSAGAVAVLFGLLFVPTLLVALLPSSWQGHHRPLPADERRRCHLHRPSRGAHARAVGRVRRVLPVHGGCACRRVRPDRAP